MTEFESEISDVLTNELQNLDEGTSQSGDRADLVAIVFQEIFAAEARNGLGQYLTPLPVADMMAKIVSAARVPRHVLDPFCGVGLLLDRVAAIAPKAQFTGVEINNSIARMAVFLAMISQAPVEVIEADAFALYLSGKIPKVDAVVANPPFGATATAANLAVKTIPTSLQALGQIPAELLGLEVCVSSLKTGGSLAIVLPQSVITNKSWADYRKHILSKIELSAIVSLPEETFAPFKGVANACVLFGKKKKTTCAQTVPFYTVTSIGYSATGRPTGASDVDAVTHSILTGTGNDRVATISNSGDVRIASSIKSSAVAVRLGDLCEVFVGKNPPPSIYCSSGPWLLKVGDLAGSMVSWRSRPKNHVSAAWYSQNEKHHLRTGDICLTAAGHRPKYIGLKVDIIDSLPQEGAMPSGEVLVIRQKDTSVAPERLLFFLRSPEGYGMIQDIVRGSTGHLYHGDVEEMLIPAVDSRYSDAAVQAQRRAVAAFRKYRKAEDAAALLASTPPSD
jgi:enamine deaminase RidA (YjgF/YER057c/UK114 family)